MGTETRRVELSLPDPLAGKRVTSGGDDGNTLDELPIHWDGQAVHLGSESYPAESHVPVFIYPNPLNPKRYVVINSGFTFREFDDLNNARQTPKLPDYAVVDIREPPTPRWPGKIVAAGFFGERWELLPPMTSQSVTGNRRASR